MIKAPLDCISMCDLVVEMVVDMLCAWRAGWREEKRGRRKCEVGRNFLSVVI